MDYKSIITRAIEKAKANGWEVGSEQFEVRYVDSDYTEFTNVLAVIWKDAAGEEKFDHVTVVSEMIFSHNFANALWPAGPSAYITTTLVGSPPAEPAWVSHWEYHLIRMVLADDPIKYLGDNI